MTEGTELQLAMDFRDFKYMSNLIGFRTKVSDPGILSGSKEGTIDIDFSKMTNSDKKHKTKFEVGGRMYWETYIASGGYQSFVTNGFFDKEDYEEPQINTVVDSFMNRVLPFSIVGIVITVLFIWYTWSLASALDLVSEDPEEDDKRMKEWDEA